MENDALGRVAHLHVALCDILDEGACHPIAIELAKSQSVAVDFPKTGKIPKVPAVALETVEQNGYPDFMEKAGKSYPSEKLLGKLFRRVDAIEVNDDQFFDEEWERPTPDPTLLIPDRQKFERETQETYRHYCYDLTCLANRFGLKREEEVFLGRALHWHPLFKSNKGKAMIAISASCAALQEKYRRLFNRGLDEANQRDRFDKASAWYDASFRGNQFNTNPFLSFGWIMSGVLCEMRQAQQFIERHSQFPVERDVAKSVLDYFNDVQIKTLQQKLSDVIPYARKIEERIRKATCGEFTAFMYGSISVFLCADSSDLDMCILETKPSAGPRTPKFIFDAYIVPCLDDMIESIILPMDYMTHPFLRCSIPCYDYVGTIDCDVSLNRQGFIKTAYLHGLFLAKPVLLPVFSLLVTWARNIGIIKSEPNDTALMATAEFYAFVLLMLSNDLPKIEVFPELVIDDIPKLLDHLHDNVKTSSGHEIIQAGQSFLNFFRKASLLKSSTCFTWPEKVTPGERTINFGENVVDLIASEAEKALVNLTFYRSAKALLNKTTNYSKTRTFTRVLSLTLSHDLSNAIAFHSKHLQVTCGLIDVTLLEDSSSLIKLTAIGTPSAISSLKILLRQYSGNNWLQSCGRPFGNSFKYFMSNSEVLLFAHGSNDESLVIHFPDYFGRCGIHHLRLPRFYPAVDIIAAGDLEKWRKRNEEILFERFRCQLRMFKQQKLDKLADSLAIYVRFGRFYLNDPSCKLQETGRSMTVKSLERHIMASRSRKFHNRGEFSAPVPAAAAAAAQQNNLQMVPLRSQSNSANAFMRKTVNIPRKKNKNKSSKVSASFIPGILLAEPPKGEHNSDDLLAVKEKIFFQALEKSGFRQIPDFSASSIGRTRRQYKWKISIKATTSFEVVVELDENQNLLEVTERPVSWIHGSILGFGPASDPLDARINVQTKEKVDPESDLFKHIFPEAIAPGKNFLEFESPTGHLRFSKVWHEKTVQNIVNVRRIYRSYIFTDAPAQSGSTNSHLCDAFVTVGTTYEGAGLKASQPFVELTLKWKKDAFIEAMNNDASFSNCRPMITKLVGRVYQMAEDIGKQITANIRQQ